jgi:hypothetical protein
VAKVVASWSSNPNTENKEKESKKPNNSQYYATPVLQKEKAFVGKVEGE